MLADRDLQPGQRGQAFQRRRTGFTSGGVTREVTVPVPDLTTSGRIGRPPVIFETERLVVREWTDSPADLDRIFDIYRREEVTRWLGMPDPFADSHQVLAAVGRWRAFYSEHGGGFGSWAVHRRDSGKVAGTI